MHLYLIIACGVGGALVLLLVLIFLIKILRKPNFIFPGDFRVSLSETQSKIKQLGKAGEIVFNKCLQVCNLHHNCYLYKGKAFAFSDNAESIAFKCQRRGKHFERRVRARFTKAIDENTVILKKQWKLERGICDFVFFWNDSKKHQRGVLIECKHSDSSRKDMLKQHVNAGIEQLHRYRSSALEEHKLNFDLLVLITDFPSTNGNLAIEVMNDVVILNFSLIEEFLEGLNQWCSITRKS